MADFSAVLAPHLKAFILARLFDDLEGSRGRSWPKKGKLAEAQQGAEETLIKQAFDLRKGSVRLKAEEGKWCKFHSSRRRCGRRHSSSPLAPRTLRPIG